jgi:NAD(P)H-flavin reductase
LQYVARYVIIATVAATRISADLVRYGDVAYLMHGGKEIDVIATRVCLPHKQGFLGDRRHRSVLLVFAQRTEIILLRTTMERLNKRTKI